MNTKEIPTRLAAPLLEKTAVVKLPIRRIHGQKVLIAAPIKSGTTIVPPGIFLTVANIFMLLPSHFSTTLRTKLIFIKSIQGLL